MKNQEVIFVWGVCPRSGTTLVQRLLASGGIFAYGEEMQLTQIDLQSIRYFSKDTPHHQYRQRFLDGEYNFWSPGVLPKQERMLKGLRDIFYKRVSIFVEDAKSEGFDRIALKEPTLMIDNFMSINKLLPNSKHIICNRNLEDIIKSAKARQFIVNEQNFIQYCQIWQNNIEHLGSLEKMNNVLVFNYDGDREKETGKLAKWLDIKVDKGILKHKINTFGGDAEKGLSDTGYIEPIELSKEEKEMVKRYV